MNEFDSIAKELSQSDFFAGVLHCLVVSSTYSSTSSSSSRKSSNSSSRSSNSNDSSSSTITTAYSSSDIYESMEKSLLLLLLRISTLSSLGSCRLMLESGDSLKLLCRKFYNNCFYT